MINREISYQRNLSGSYMKIPISRINEFDEKLILRKKLPGLIPVERSFVNGKGEYWYQISGKQSLDTYCRIQDIGIEFVEKVILSICSEIEILEWNLFDTNCLQLEPELIYVASQSKEILFCVYPENQQSLSLSFQQLMEYLLTKIDHKDQAAVKMAYEIYEKTLDEAYSIMDIREFIIQNRKAKAEALYETSPELPVKQPTKTISRESFRQAARPSRRETIRQSSWQSMQEFLGRNSIQEKAAPMEEKNSHGRTTASRDTWSQLMEKLKQWKQEVGDLLQREGEGKLFRTKETKEYGYVELEENELEKKPEVEIHPTICINERKDLPEGILIYEGSGNYPDLQIKEESSIVGKSKDACFQIEKDTISRHHAKLTKKEDGYYIEDLNSTNGTFVNNELLSYKEKRELKTNDRVLFGDMKYRFI